MRLRLKRFLNFLETSPRASRGLLASLDADTCQWVRSARVPEAVARGGGEGGGQSEKEAGEPLRSTHGVLLCLARALPRESRHKVGRRVVLLFSRICGGSTRRWWWCWYRLGNIKVFLYSRDCCTAVLVLAICIKKRL